VKRGEREQITRSIHLRIPVVNLATFSAARDDLVYALYTLSHDAWDITFIQKPGNPEASRSWQGSQEGKVLLFSGGLDALSGAIHLGDAGKPVFLISHVTANQAVSAAQDWLSEYVDRQYPNLFTRHAFRIGARSQPAKGFPFPSDQLREDSQRTRSLLFLVIAALVARRKGVSDVVVIAENGQMAIHLPLSSARISAFSTHTAHPTFLRVAATLLSNILGYEIRIENPFLYQTKAEAIGQTARAHQSALTRSISCWQASRIAGGLHHCGFCIPCLVRRIAVEHNGLRLSEYKRDLFSEDVLGLDPQDDGKRNLMELAEFVHVFGSSQSQAQLEDSFPDLVCPDFDAEQAASMYRRFAGEARGVFQQHASLASFLT
jgi:7-cyano-7-deazaguanine synthase in queuosine biosynthesis